MIFSSFQTKPARRKNFFILLMNYIKKINKLSFHQTANQKKLQHLKTDCSRFASGLIQDIQAPDFETKIAILKKKVEQERYNIDEEVLNFIAENVNTNIREMEGLLSKVYFFATLLGKKQATLVEANEVFKDQQDIQKEQTSPKQIISTVCTYFGISEDIIGKNEAKEIVEPRMIAIYLINEILDLPLTAIGKLFRRKRSHNNYTRQTR